MFISHYQNAGQTLSMNVVNRLFQNVVKFKYLEKIPTNKKCLTSIVRGSNAGVLHWGLPRFSNFSVA
jgi:hypothetical protein